MGGPAWAGEGTMGSLRVVLVQVVLNEPDRPLPRPGAYRVGFCPFAKAPLPHDLHPPAYRGRFTRRTDWQIAPGVSASTSTGSSRWSTRDASSRVGGSTTIPLGRTAASPLLPPMAHAEQS